MVKEWFSYLINYSFSNHKMTQVLVEGQIDYNLMICLTQNDPFSVGTYGSESLETLTWTFDKTRSKLTLLW